MSTAYSAASVIIPNSAGVKAGTLQAWRPDVNLLQDIDVSRPAITNVASYVDNTGKRVFVGANVPRWDWSEGLSCPSLLIEEQRTNLFDQDLEGAGIVTQTVTVVSGTEYSVSVEGSGSMTLSGAGTGTVTEGSHVTFTASATSLTLTLTGALDYCQVEAGAHPSSIIYTSGSTATRNKDNISKSGIASLIGQSEGTLYVQIKLFDVLRSGFGINLDNNTNNNRVAIAKNTANSQIRFLITKGGVNELDLFNGNYSSSDYVKISVGYAKNNFVTSVDGINITDDAGNTFSGTTLNNFRFFLFFGRIRALAWWKTRLTNAEIANLTTP